MRWRVEPRFGYGSAPMRLETRGSYPVATSGSNALAVCAWDAGAVQCDGVRRRGRFRDAGRRARDHCVVAAHAEPLVFPVRAETERRAEATVDFWRRWAAQLTYTGPWRDAVVRSALALKLLVFAPSGAIAAAPTTSLPEALGGERNWDYRYSWIRDSSFTVEALLQLGCHAEATSFFWWFMHATRLTLPRLQVFYRLDGGAACNRADAAARWVPWLSPGSDRQRGLRAVAARRIRRAARHRISYMSTGVTVLTATQRATSRASPISCAHTGANPTRGSGKCVRPHDTTRSPRPCAGSRSIVRYEWQTSVAFRPDTPRGGARRQRRSGDSSTSTAGHRKRDATCGTPGLKSSMQASS